MSMKIHTVLPQKDQFVRPVVTLGTFDGVHMGHRKILDRLNEKAKSIDGQSVVITFDPHPRKVLFPHDDNIKLINTLTEKIQNFENAGVDHVVILPFTKDFSRLTALEFVRDYLVNLIGVHEFVIGYDHHFGRNREGSIENLKEMAATYGFGLEEIPVKLVDEVSVSSTKIRHAILEGDIEQANHFLGYSFLFSGIVEHGAKKGRALGFPTANLNLPDRDKIIPSNGVYTVVARLGQNEFNGIMNIGLKPTVGNFTQRFIEVHLFDFNDEIYDEVLTIKVINRIRDEKKFNGLDELKDQIGKDIVQAKLMLKVK